MNRILNAIGRGVQLIRREPVVTAGVVTAAVGLGTSLGLPDDVAVSITGLFGAISALIARSLVTPGSKLPPPPPPA